MTITDLTLRRFGSVIVPQRVTEDTSGVGPTLPQHIAALQMNLARAGYVLSGDVADALLPDETGAIPLDDFQDFANALFATALKARRGTKKYVPFYPNFPTQVADASDTELIFNALMHYFGDGIGLRITPAFEKKARPILDELRNVTTVKLITGEPSVVLGKLFTKTTGQKTVFTPQDKDDLNFIHKWAEENKVNIVVADSIPAKENLAWLVTLVGLDAVISRAKTITDVLRVAAGISETDVSLSHVRFGKITRSTRKSILAALNRFSVINWDEIAQRQEIWRLLGEKLHPGEYAKRYPNAHKVFQVARQKETIATFNSKVEAAIKDHDWDKVIDLLSSRPGLFARRLDEVLRIAESGTVFRSVGIEKAPSKIVDAFNRVAPSVSSTVLWQLRNHLLNRDVKLRTFFIKGSASNVFSIANELPELSTESIMSAVSAIDSALASQYEDKGELGRVWVDPQLARFTIPSNVRQASRALNTVGRGSVLPLNATDKDTIRFFIWWRDGVRRTDLDLSVLFLDEGMQIIDTVTYYHIRGQYGALHSGDTTSAPKGASEFIDVPVQAHLNAGVRYVVPTIMNFTNQLFSELPECYAGVMVRGNVKSGEVYEPSAVQEAFDITADTTVSLPLIIDLQSKEAKWVDVSLTADPSQSNNVRSNKTALKRLVSALVEQPYSTLYDLFTAHAKARGTLVENKANAETVFEVVDGRPSITSEDVAADYL